jgi:hypothetical protein
MLEGKIFTIFLKRVFQVLAFWSSWVSVPFSVAADFSLDLLATRMTANSTLMIIMS